ncbi:MAG: FAD-binding oxidoreductase [Micromonosporaceae bacterium]
MPGPALAEVAADAARRAPEPAALQRLVTALTSASIEVSTVEAVRRAASTDFAHLSPILPGLLPARPADAVVLPRSIEELTTAVALAHGHGVPITPRGKGTGNYGQAVPLAGGIVVDLTRVDQVLNVGPGWVRAQAGSTFVALEAAARRHGQELAMSPTTVGSTLGGFLAGGAGGVGSIEHGWLWDGFVLALDVITCPPGAELLTVAGDDCRPYLHAYGVTGIIAAATVQLRPARDWTAVLASFPADAATPAADAGLAAMRLDPPPRSVSLDDPSLVALYPPDQAMPPSRFSLRCTVDTSTVDRLHDIVTAHGGRVEAVRPSAPGYLATLAFNHVTLRARQANSQLCHLQVSGDALRHRRDDVLATLPGAMLHLDGLRTHADPADAAAGRGYGGLLLSEFRDTATLYAGVAALRQLGVYVVDPHTWLLDGPALPAIRQTARRNDPAGLLNPGKLPPPNGASAGS